MLVKARLSWGELDLRSVRSPEELPEEFNLTAALLDRHIVEGRGNNRALVGPAGNLSYEQLYRLTNQVGNAMRALGVGREDRVLLILRDSPEAAASFLAAMKIGAIPSALNIFAHPNDYEFYLRHSRARLLIAEADLLPPLEPFLWKHNLRAVISVRGNAPRAERFQETVAAHSPELDPAPTHRDEAAHWVYTSGSTGEPKAAVHLHRSTVFSVEPYVRHVIQMTPQDINFSISPLFSSYGLANGLFMPLWIGAAACQLPERPQPERILEILKMYRPTLMYWVPTGYGRLLRECTEMKELNCLRLCISAGEALPAPIYEEWRRRTGLDILDGVGSTENGYIFLSNRPGEIWPGTSGKMLPGYGARLVNPEGHDVPDGEVGELQISSHSAAAFYWRNHAASKKTFVGEWLRTGDKYLRDAQGVYTYLGRADDMFKSGGFWVSPIQVESTLLEHPSVAEASVVAERDPNGLEKPVAYLVLRSGHQPSPELEEDLQRFTRQRLTAYKCPKTFRFVADLPKTASGKIQRFKLRTQSV